MNGAIRVLVADDHAIVRKGIRALLATEPDMEVVGEAADGREAIAEAQKLCPDVVVMDLSMPARTLPPYCIVLASGDRSS